MTSQGKQSFISPYNKGHTLFILPKLHTQQTFFKLISSRNMTSEGNQTFISPYNKGHTCILLYIIDITVSVIS
jgi:diadenosine tetraphosphate (Ap4A) HIT family hydrolase